MCSSDLYGAHGARAVVIIDRDTLAVDVHDAAGHRPDGVVAELGVCVRSDGPDTLMVEIDGEATRVEL